MPQMLSLMMAGAFRIFFTMTVYPSRPRHNKPHSEYRKFRQSLYSCVIHIHLDISSYINGIRYNDCCYWIADSLISIFHNYFPGSHITAIAVIVRSILLLQFTIHNNFSFFTVNEHIRCEPASTFNVKPAASVIIC